MKDIFNQHTSKIHPKDSICHSGGAIGSDTIWENAIIEYGGEVRAYSYKTKYHNSLNKVEISDKDFEEGILEIKKANKYMNRHGISKYMNLLARNWCQVKYSNQILAIGKLIKVGEKGSKGHINKGKYTLVDGGTGFAVMMGILNNKKVFVFDQETNQWYRWSYTISEYIEVNELDVYLMDINFTGIGTRQINNNGIRSIKKVLSNSI